MLRVDENHSSGHMHFSKHVKTLLAEHVTVYFFITYSRHGGAHDTPFGSSSDFMFGSPASTRTFDGACVFHKWAGCFITEKCDLSICFFHLFPLKHLICLIWYHLVSFGCCFPEWLPPTWNPTLPSLSPRHCFFQLDCVRRTFGAALKKHYGNRCVTVLQSRSVMNQLFKSMIVRLE